jgi:hypothetical protein
VLAAAHVEIVLDERIVFRQSGLNMGWVPGLASRLPEMALLWRLLGWGPGDGLLPVGKTTLSLSHQGPSGQACDAAAESVDPGVRCLDLNPDSAVH